MSVYTDLFYVIITSDIKSANSGFCRAKARLTAHRLSENVETRFCFARWAKFAAFAAMCLDGTLKSCYNIKKEGTIDGRSLKV